MVFFFTVVYQSEYRFNEVIFIVWGNRGLFYNELPKELCMIYDSFRITEKIILYLKIHTIIQSYFRYCCKNMNYL